MWKPFRIRAQSWGLNISNPTSSSAADAKKSEYELRVLNMLLPMILDVVPERILKRESPDFEVLTTSGSLYIEIVDAVPDAVLAPVSASDPVRELPDTINLSERRSRKNAVDYNGVPYYVKNAQFGETIAKEINKKIAMAKGWLSNSPMLRGRLNTLAWVVDHRNLAT